MRYKKIGEFGNLLLCLVVTSVTEPFRQAIQSLKATMAEVAPGYLFVETRPYRLLVVDLEEVVKADGDEWMSIFVPSTMLTAAARRWLEEHMPASDIPAYQKLEGHGEVLARLLQATPPEEILRAACASRLLDSLPAEERLAGLEPEPRLARLSPEQRLLAMPDGVLAGLSVSTCAPCPKAYRRRSVNARRRQREV